MNKPYMGLKFNPTVTHFSLFFESVLLKAINFCFLISLPSTLFRARLATFHVTKGTSFMFFSF